MSLYKEISFETEICEHLAEHGWLYAGSDAAGCDRTRVLFSADVLAWGAGHVAQGLGNPDEEPRRAGRALATGPARTPPTCWIS